MYFIGSLLLSIIGAITPILAAQEILKLTNNMVEELLFIAVIIFIVEILRNTFRYFSQKSSQIFFRETLLDIQSEVAKKLLHFEIATLDKSSSGVFIDRMSRDTRDIADIFNQINYSIADIATNIGILIAIFFINKYMFIFFIFSLIILFWFKKTRMKYWFEMDNEYRKLNEKNTSFLSELIRGLRDIKVLNAGKIITEKMNEKLFLSNQKRYEMSKIDRKYRFFSGSVQDIMDLVFIILGIFLTSRKMLSVSNFVVLYMYRDKIYWLLDYVSQFIEVLKNYNLSAKRVFELFDSNIYPTEKFGNFHLNKASGDFEFKNVSFEYKSNISVLKNINFKVRANEIVSFVGKSGTGKSTIFSLLTKLYNVNEGKILIDNININDLDEESIRENITIITQSPYIFNFSIKENLLIVNDKATDEEMIKACKSACLHDFIMSLPDQYETIVGEGGIILSGGERQRLAIARALLKKSEIILFDEATSSLDNQTQMAIQQAINNIKGIYTILIIAHRLSTVINSDRIIVIEKGKVSGIGTHKYLYKHNKIYRNLYEKELTE